MRSQHAAITLQLHRHVRRIASVEEEEVESDKGKLSDLGLVGCWLKGRLIQTVLEVCLKLLRLLTGNSPTWQFLKRFRLNYLGECWRSTNAFLIKFKSVMGGHSCPLKKMIIALSVWLKIPRFLKNPQSFFN